MIKGDVFVDLTYILSQVFIIFNYVFLAITYGLKSRKSILSFNILSIVTTATSYGLLSAWSGCVMCFVSLTRNIIFLLQEGKEKSEKITVSDWTILSVLYLISIIFAILTYDGLFSLLSVFAVMLYTLSVWQKNAKVYKILGVPINVLWIGYNIFVKSIFGVICETILLVFVIYELIVYCKTKGVINKKEQIS